MINERMRELAGLEISEKITADDTQHMKGKVPYKVMELGNFFKKYGTPKLHKDKIIGITKEGIEFKSGKTKSLQKWEYVPADNIIVLVKGGTNIHEIAYEYSKGTVIRYAIGNK